MPTVEPEKLTQLLDESGVSSRTRKKLEEANTGEKPKEEKKKPARGHGCATPNAGPARI